MLVLCKSEGKNRGLELANCFKEERKENVC